MHQLRISRWLWITIDTVKICNQGHFLSHQKLWEIRSIWQLHWHFSGRDIWMRSNDCRWTMANRKSSSRMCFSSDIYNALTWPDWRFSFSEQSQFRRDWYWEKIAAIDIWAGSVGCPIFSLRAASNYHCLTCALFRFAELTDRYNLVDKDDDSFELTLVRISKQFPFRVSRICWMRAVCQTRQQFSSIIFETNSGISWVRIMSQLDYEIIGINTYEDQG